ncbi:hypothetical protein BSO21_06400 [Paenibacillus odorifer]|uniref:Uncharacterized protein n=1 Tax=Paenibacillus odorifer TaxID=189426 RepID=A0ABX3GUP6_9BACL|nr:hypothetical protein BSO21_06400 [Paenibacillus odorifer]
MLIDELLQAESWGIIQAKLVAAIKEAIAMGEVEKLSKLRTKIPYSFENSLKHLKKTEREFIRNG